MLTTKSAHHCAWVMTSHLRSPKISRYEAIALLEKDIEAIAAEEKVSNEGAAWMLEQRIGGFQNLESYVKTLQAQANRKGK